MKKRTKRLLAMLLASAMILQQGSTVAVLATESEPASETVTEKTAATEAETKTPETKAPETQAETKAPETAAPETQAVSETQATEAAVNATQTEATTSETTGTAAETTEKATEATETEEKMDVNGQIDEVSDTEDAFDLITLGADRPMTIAELENKNLDGYTSSVNVAVKEGNGDDLSGEPHEYNSSFKLEMSYTIDNEKLKLLQDWAKEHPGEPVVLEYQMPAAMVATTQPMTGKLTSPDGTKELGEYQIDPETGKIYFKFNNDFVIKNSSIEGTFNYFFGVSAESIDKKTEVEFHFPGSATVPKIEFKQPKVEGKKTDDQTKLNEDGTITFNIDFENKEPRTAENVVVTDIPASNLEVIYESIMVSINGSEPTKLDAGKLVKLENGSFQIQLGEIPANAKVSISYKAKIKETDLDSNNDGKIDNVSNQITWTVNGQTGGDVTDWTSVTKQSAGSKSGSANGNYGMKWTVELNNGSLKSDVSGYVYKDAMSSENQKFVEGSLEVYDEDDNRITDACTVEFAEDGKTFTVKLPNNAGKKSYKITYETVMDHAGENVTVSNEGEFGPEEGEKTPIPGPGPQTVPGGSESGLEKNVEWYDVNGSPFLIPWKSTIKVNPFATTLVYEDQITKKDNFGSMEESAYLGAWFKEDSIEITTKSGKALTSSDYEIVFCKSSDACNKGNDKMKITFKNAQIYAGDEIYITYKTYHDKTDKYDGTEDDIIYVYNTGHVGNLTVEAETFFSIAKTPNIVKSVDTNNTKYDESLGAYVVSWILRVNDAGLGNEGDLDFDGSTVEIIEDLPEGLEFVLESAYCTQWGKRVPSWGSEEQSGVWTKRDEPINPSIRDGKLVFTIQDVEKDIIELKFKTKVTKVPNPDEIVNDNNTEKTKLTFTNNASWNEEGKEELGKTSKTVDVTYQVLDKEGMVPTDDNTVIQYTVDVNKWNIDYLPDADIITLKDRIPENVNLVDGSVEFVDSDEAPVIGASYYYDSKTRVLTVEIPDGTYVKIRYKAKPDLTKATKDNTGNYYITVDNNICMVGHESVHDSVNKQYTVREAAGTVAGDRHAITLKKVDAQNTGDKLSGAKFKLVEIRFEEDGSATEKLIVEKPTTEEGTLIFDGLAFDTIYYYQETKAPNGFELDNTRYYFIVKDQPETYARIKEKYNKLDYSEELNTFNGAEVITITNRRRAVAVITATKNLEGADLDDYTFNFTLTAVDENGIPLSGDEAYSRTVSNVGSDITFPEISYESEGTFYYKIEEQPGDATGITYDNSSYIVRVDVSYNHLLEQNVAIVTYPEDEITFTNTYTQKGSLIVSKALAGDNTDTTQLFHFKVELTGTGAADVTGKYGDMTFSGGVAEFELKGGESKEAKNLPAGLSYTVTESNNEGYTVTKSGDTGTITADTTKTAAFTNTRNKTKAELKVEKTYNDTFPTEKDEQFSFTLTAGNNNVVTTPPTATPMPEGSDGSSKTVKVPSSAPVTFGEITYEQDGIYNYTITENSGSLHGVTYDTSVYHVKVEVTTDGTGAKKAEISVAKAENAETLVADRDYQLKEGTIYTAEFNNTYVADGSAELSVQKVYNGDAFPTGDKAFKFTLTAGDNTTTLPEVETPMPEGSSTDGTKTVPVTSSTVQSFGTIAYEQDGNYFYTIKEVTTGTGLLSNVIYDEKVYHIKVSVTTETEGETATKKATVSYRLSDEGTWTDTNQAAFTATFTNYKIQDAKAELKVNKTYAYGTWPTDDNAFKFELTGKESKKTDGTVIATPMPTPSVIQVSKDNPTATFGEITFPADGTYLYQISEQEGTLADITYDDTVYDVKISVSTETDGSRNVVIQSKKSTEGEESYARVSGTVFTAEFVNIHREELKDASGSLTLNATKTMKKDSDKSRIPEFQFELAWAGTGLAPAEQTLPMTVNADADGTISFTLAFDMDDYEAAHPETDDPKEFKYTLKEVKGSDADVIYDDTTYNITVTLGNEIGTDDKFGVTYTVEGNKALTFINDTKTEVQIEKVDEEDNALSGAKLVIRDASGKIVGKPWISDGKPHSVKLLDGKYTLSEIEAPAGYEVSQDVPFEVPDKEGNTVIKVKMTDKKTVETKRSLKVTKRLHLDGITSDIMVRTATYYVALFTDAARTQRVTDVKKIVFNNENTSSATFDNLEAGVTYYVGETDENGTVIPAGKISENMIYYPTYDDNATFKFEGKKAKEEGLAEFTNVYTEWPNYFYLSGQLTVTKQVLLGGEECDSDDTFYARVFNDARLKDPVSDEVLVLDMAGGSRTSVTVTNLPIGDTPESSRKYYVAETDEYGNPLDPDEVTEYTISIDKSEVTLDASSAGAEVVITNDFHEEESEFESESEVDEKKTAPKTGDDTNFAKYLFLLTLSAGTCAVLFEEKRRKDRAEQ